MNTDMLPHLNKINILILGRTSARGVARRRAGRGLRQTARTYRACWAAVVGSATKLTRAAILVDCTVI